MERAASAVPDVLAQGLTAVFCGINPGRVSAGAAARLEQIADELRPRAIGFVGKEAYRGAFRERPELGLQERRLADTLLFVLPSTSPANAAVPYAERLRWFRAFRQL